MSESFPILAHRLQSAGSTALLGSAEIAGPRSGQTFPVSCIFSNAQFSPKLSDCCSACFPEFSRLYVAKLSKSIIHIELINHM